MITVTGDSVFLDIGYKIEGIIPLAEFQKAGEAIKPGDKVPVNIKGRGEDGYYELSTIKVDRPKDWSSLEKAFADKAAIAGVSHGRGQGRRERRRGRARLHAGLAQRSARRRRDGKAGRPGNPLPHHQARCRG